jgi:hypothetical protein
MDNPDPLAPEPTPTPASTAPGPFTTPPSDSIEDQINGLRKAVILLLGGLVLSTICFGLFLYKQNNLLIAQIDSQTRVLNQNEPVYQATKQKLGAFLQDLAGYAQTHNDVVPILVKYNFVRVQQQPATTPAVAPVLPVK